jgi:hypothetical protein
MPLAERGAVPSLEVCEARGEPDDQPDWLPVGKHVDEHGLRDEGDERGLDRQRLGSPTAAQQERTEERAQQQEPDRPELDDRHDQ